MSGNDEGFDPDRNAEQIEGLRELSGKALDPLPHLIGGAVVLSIPYLIVNYGHLVNSPLVFPQHFEHTVALATTFVVGFVLLIIVLSVGLFIASHGIAWWVERRDVRKARRYEEAER